ncbi:MAG: hypothetical protein V4857_09330 [Pseudomonadota bacterium]
MLQFDVITAQLDGLHASIGLFVARKTQPEIAISILAQLTAVRNGIGLARTQI